MRATVLVAVLALLGVLVDASPAPADLLSVEKPRLLDPEPAPGSVVPEGRVVIRARAASAGAVTSQRMKVGGEDVELTLDADGYLSAELRLDAGSYKVELWAENEGGRSGRAWRFVVSPLHVSRLAGSGRIETAVEISRDLHPEEAGAGAAVLARADAFPDALAGVPLAHAEGGPLLLTASSGLSDPVAAELRRVLPPGATVYLLGGEGALAAGVAADVGRLGFVAVRLAGDDRFGTAVVIARQLPGEFDHAVLASGDDYADALAASSPAAVHGWPVLLTRPASLPDTVRDFVVERGLAGVHVVGGQAAVSAAVRTQVRTLVDGVSRTAGATRFETAAAVGERWLPGAEVVALASGGNFPDALAGGVHAAAHGAPLLLAASSRVFNPQLVQIGAAQPSRAYAFGGQAALGTPALYDLLRAAVDAGGPLPRMLPASGEVRTLDEVVVSFDRDVDPERSTVHVTVAGREVGGRVSGGEFASELVFKVADMPQLEPGRSYPGRVVVAASDGESTRHLEQRFTYRQPFRTLSRGDTGGEVAELQRRLRDTGYWVGAVDGRFGSLTHQAVLALQKVHGLPRDGAYDEATRRVLESGPPRPRARSGPGDGLYYEIDLERQVLMRVVNGQVTWIFNTSTGHGRTYTFEGSTFRATTTTGNHPVVRQIDGMREAPRGQLWRPKYYDDRRGIALHGSASVPEYPASAGCIRVTNAAMDFIWSLDPAPSGRVLVYPDDYY